MSTKVRILLVDKTTNEKVGRLTPKNITNLKTNNTFKFENKKYCVTNVSISPKEKIDVLVHVLPIKQ